MSKTICISDNNPGVRMDLSSQQWEDLSFIAGKKVSELCSSDEDESSLLVFPDSLSLSKDDIGKSPVFTIQGDRIATGNLMGFIGYRDTTLKVFSRFDREEDDYLMHYLLERVLSINLFDLPHSTDAEQVFNFLLFLFPFFLRQAMVQGLFRQYITYKRNDSNVRGVIDIARHIRENIPFTGKIAYRSREYSGDNDLTELIRHTIEYIRTKLFGHSILDRDEDIKGFIAEIIEATPTYALRERQHVINRNLRPRIHPYYSEYEPLRRICLQILREEEIKYGERDEKVYGVLFDGAWLWEEYLNTLLERVGFKHPENKKQESKGFKSLFVSGKGKRYPDFFNDTMILDAKYKKYDGKTLSDVSREDVAQVISYMHVRPAMKGGLLVPGEGEEYFEKETLRGLGGDVFILSLPIARESISYDSFCTTMANNETKFIESICSLE